MTVGMPCEPCNNGWMSALENEAKDFMTPMVFRGDEAYVRNISLVPYGTPPHCPMWSASE
jgi:hypothetical protein